ncbi:H-NS histone family protein [Tabrizicola oligotrophica]|uniref:H-NS histone family protein n=1 Tax=Tabrizicola oligotrophica TaxID=2710650 RepID=A0A6M0QW93_9RHOB|nr:H-NS histone family protein [Tabrizicola oligotrophica]NEY91756.1 H-NS histone family protein [Tabrizicola oligotrophica]
MDRLNIEAMTLKELQSLEKSIAKSISTFKGRQKAEALAKVEALAKELGFVLTDLIGAERPKSIRAPATAKYHHPENFSITWSGRGRRPQWFIDHVDAGNDPSTLAV